ncbi:hypothetical protein D3C83_103550 [compost metagenome]
MAHKQFRFVAVELKRHAGAIFCAVVELFGRAEGFICLVEGNPPGFKSEHRVHQHRWLPILHDTRPHEQDLDGR